MNGKKSKVFFIILLVVSAFFFNVSAWEYKPEIELPNANLAQNDEAVLSFIIKNSKTKFTLKPFRCEIKFDSNNLKYGKINCKGDIKRNDIKVEKNKGFLTLIYNPKKQKEISIQNNKSEIFETTFKVKNKASSGTSLIHADFKSLDSDLIKYSNNLKINISGNPEADNCKLKVLIPDTGRISPDFNPNILEYVMEVPAEIQYIYFNAVPMNENLSIKTNRKKLAAAGKNTYIKITVSNKSLKLKSVYKIEVKRRSKTNENKSKTSEKAQSSIHGSKEESETKDKNENKVKYKNKNKNHKESSKYDCTDVENQDNIDELENESIKFENNSDVFTRENNSFKIYLIAIFCLLIFIIASYFIIRFVKFRKNLCKKPNNSINNNSKK